MMASLHARSRLSLTSSLSSETWLSSRFQPVEHDDIHQQGIKWYIMLSAKALQTIAETQDCRGYGMGQTSAMPALALLW